MNKTTRLLSLLIASAVALSAAHHKHGDQDLVLDAAAQKALTPDAVLKDLMAGNARFVKGKLSNYKSLPEQVAATTKGQYPQAIILSCVDSRVPVEMVFDQRVGDVFVARVAGNMENVDILGSMEFATAAAGSKLVMVLGHQACGAVKGACDHVQLGNLTALLEKIQPAILDVADEYPADARHSGNAAFVDEVVRANVRRTVADIRRDSPLLAGMEREGKIKIVGAYYSLEDGTVSMVD
ncbi:MAG TPA: carbonic anhydrase family protein [Opitutales bacterium]|nr:carbonic anhydrase family protein [Opitutales bacterium]